MWSRAADLGCESRQLLEVALAGLEFFEVAAHRHQRVTPGRQVALDGGSGLREGPLDPRRNFGAWLGPDPLDRLANLDGHFRLSSHAKAFELAPDLGQLNRTGFHLIGEPGELRAKLGCLLRHFGELIAQLGCLFRHLLARQVMSASRDLTAQAVQI